MPPIVRLLSACLLGGWLLGLDAEHVKGAFDIDAKRPVTVADCIRMTMLGDPGYFAGGPALDHVATFSPNGKEFVVVLRKGDLERNTNVFSLLLWRTEEVFHSSTPRVLLSMSSSSNRNAIGEVKWLGDNETLTFLGEQPGELRQLYTFNIRSNALVRLTNHPTSLISYSVTSNANSITYFAERPPEVIWGENARRRGIIVSTQSLWDLVVGQKLAGYPPQLFFQLRGETGRRIETSDVLTYIANSHIAPSISPDGRHILVITHVADVPGSWKEYADKLCASMAGKKLPPGQVNTSCVRYVLIDTRTGESRPLLSSPLAEASSSRAVWSSDGQSVVVTQTYLPLDHTDSAERKRRQSQWYAVEVSVPSRDFMKVSDEDLKRLALLAWEKETNQLVFLASPASENVRPGSKVLFRKSGANWEKVTDAKAQESRPEILIEEDTNTPPRIFAANSTTPEKALLLDLNPEFSRLKFGIVEDIRFKASDGHEGVAGLYYPADYVPGKKYPLVIQTHGWYPKLHRFWINGFSTTSNAAQPLAGKGILVLQVDEMNPGAMGTPKDAEQAMAVYEGAIDYLDEKGLIDRNLVGIIGFSQTCYYVKYALTHSKYHFAAASVAEGFDSGYFNYILNAATYYTVATHQEGQNGGLPFGAGLKLWMENSPGFNIDKVHTPVLITAPRPITAMIEWEWFSALTRLGKPVEMVVMQDGTHELEKPWDRMISQGGNVDWFSFWLKSEEDPDPAKAEQYGRWRQLRKLQEENTRQPQRTNPPSVH